MENSNVFETFADLSALIKILENGAEDVIYISRNGVKLAQLKLLPEEERINVSEKECTIPEGFDHLTKFYFCN